MSGGGYSQVIQPFIKFKVYPNKELIKVRDKNIQ
jgi:hypothetical protein